MEGLAAEPSSLSSLQLDLARQPGAQEVLDEAATARTQARHMTLRADGEGALNMLKRLEGLPNLHIGGGDGLRAGLHGAKVVGLCRKPVRACAAGGGGAPALAKGARCAPQLGTCHACCRGWRS